MDVYVAVVIILIGIGLGTLSGYSIFSLSERYWKHKYEEIAKNVDKKVSEVIHSMDIEMFKIEKELVERQYEDKGE